jgi:glycerophosphoryl diester phosphodiesterase
MLSPRLGLIFGAALLALLFARVPPQPGSTENRVVSHPGPFQSKGTRPLVIAHRGGHHLRPENTLAAFQHALELGSDVLEMDIRLTRDRIPVVFHDDSVERTTDGRGFLHEMTLAQVKSLDAGYHFRPPDSDRRFPYRGAGISVPTLEEVFQAFARVPIIIEIKPRQNEAVDPVAALIERFQRWDITMVASFHGSVLQAARNRFPRMLTSASPAQVRNLWLLTRIGMGRFYRSEMKALQVPEFYGRLHIADERFIRAARSLGVPVHVWTVDEIDPMQRLIALGVDGIITGRPDRLRKLNRD